MDETGGAGNRRHHRRDRVAGAVHYDEYGYGRFPNVILAMGRTPEQAYDRPDFPGSLIRPAMEKNPNTSPSLIVFGSRDKPEPEQ